jgi:hypothetical protein
MKLAVCVQSRHVRQTVKALSISVRVALAVADIGATLR